ncbi:MAG: hypothetical protein AAGJ81_10830 [Verrucomicrobiota bacterium]
MNQTAHKTGLVSLILFGASLVSQGVNSAPDDLSTAETVADRRLAEIIEAEGDLVRASEAGTGEESLLLKAQEIATRYEEFLENNPDHLYGWILCGKFLYSIGGDDRSFLAFQKAESLSPDLPVVQRYLGLILADSQEYELALAYHLRAVELDPKEPTYHDDLGRFLQRYGSSLEADGVLEEGRASVLAGESFALAFDLEPESFERGWRWAEAFTDMPDPDWGAVAGAWERVNGLSQTKIEREATRLQVARALIELGDFKEAQKWMNPVSTEVLQPSLEQLMKRLEKSAKN